MGEGDAILGRAARVSGLEEWVRVARKAGAEHVLVEDTPGASFSGVDADLSKWAAAWGAQFAVRVRDNRSERTYLVEGFVQSQGLDSMRWALNKVEPVDLP